MGVFTAANLHKGALVWKFDPDLDLIITLEDYLSLEPRRKLAVTHHAQWYAERAQFVLGADGDYFMNHANDPTLTDRGNTMIAARYLPIGTELTCDYRIVKVLGFTPTDDLSSLTEQRLQHAS